MSKFEEMNPFRNLENPRSEIHEGRDRDALPQNKAPELTEVGEANLDPDRELEEGFKKKKLLKKKMEFRERHEIASDDVEHPEDVYYDPTEGLDARIDAGEEEEPDTSVDEVRGPKPNLPPEIEKIDKAANYMPLEEWSKLSREERKKILQIRKDPRAAVAEEYMTPKKRFVRKKKIENEAA